MSTPLQALLAGVSAFVMLGLLSTAVSAEVKIEDQIVGPAYEQGVTYVLSPKGLHLATVHPKAADLRSRWTAWRVRLSTKF